MSVQQQQRSGEPTGELARVKQSSAATIDDLRQFVGQMKGRSPQEMLGLVAESGLFRAICLSVLGWGVLLLLLTVGPYLWPQSETASPGESQPAAAAAASDQQPAEDESLYNPPPPPGDSLTERQKAAEALGIVDETKSAAPDANPLDKSIDNLLEGID